MIAVVTLVFTLAFSLSKATLDFEGCNGVGLTDPDEGTEWPFATDVCGSIVQENSGSFGFQFVCSSGEVSFEQYNTTDCSNDAILTISNIEDDVVLNMFGSNYTMDVNCADSNDDCSVTYLSATYSDSDCSTEVGHYNLPYVGGVCMRPPDTNVSMIIACDGEDDVTEEYYSDTSCSSLIRSTPLNESCIARTSDGETYYRQNTYTIDTLDCESDDDDDDAAFYLYSSNSIIIALSVAASYIFVNSL